MILRATEERKLSAKTASFIKCSKQNSVDILLSTLFRVKSFLCKALWITIVYEMCYINKLALPYWKFHSYWCQSLKLKTSYLVLLFKAVTLPTLHLSDVLEQVCHSDGRLELAGLVGHLHRLTASIWVRLDGHRGLGHLTVAAICERTIHNPWVTITMSNRQLEGCCFHTKQGKRGRKLLYLWHKSNGLFQSWSFYEYILCSVAYSFHWAACLIYSLPRKGIIHFYNCWIHNLPCTVYYNLSM